MVRELILVGFNLPPVPELELLDGIPFSILRITLSRLEHLGHLDSVMTFSTKFVEINKPFLSDRRGRHPLDAPMAAADAAGDVIQGPCDLIGIRQRVKMLVDE